MNSINSDEDQWMSMIFELVFQIIEAAIIISDTPSDEHQMISSARVEIRLVLDEILQMKPEDRTHENMRQSVIGMMDRLVRNRLLTTQERSILLEFIPVANRVTHELWLPEDEQGIVILIAMVSGIVEVITQRYSGL